MEKKGKFYILPNLLSQTSDVGRSFVVGLNDVVASLDGLIAESTTEGRRFLKKFKTKKPAHEIPIAVFSKKEQEDPSFYFEPIVKGESWGYVVDAGMPCLADPGYALVDYAHSHSICVDVIQGPSSLMLSLILSGLSSQKFSFHGYLPQDSKELSKIIKELEVESKLKQSVQMFIEAPHRNETTWKVLLETLHPATSLFVGIDLMSSDEFFLTQSVREWKQKEVLSFQKKAAIFLFKA